MRIEWKNCNKEILQELNEWLKYPSLGQQNIINYAMFDSTFSADYEYYQTEEAYYNGIIKNYNYAVYIDNQLMAYVTIIYYYEIKYYATINPICINPSYQGKDIGKYIIADLINNYSTIIDNKLDYIIACISNNNFSSKKLFTKMGFIKSEESDDNTYTTYQYELTRKIFVHSNYIMFYHHIDEKYIADFCDNLNMTIINLNNFNYPKLNKVTINICSTIKEYIYRTNKKEEEYEEWMVGNTNYATKEICILSPRVSKLHDFNSLIKVLAHEYVHYFFDEHFGFYESTLWINEGLALLYANQIYLNMLSLDSYPKIQDLCENFVDNEGYTYAGVYVWYIIKKYGINYLKDLYQEQLKFTDNIEKIAIMEILNNNKSK